MPRYRQRLAFVLPLQQGRPKWVDDPHLNLRYHVRATALPAPGDEDQLKELAGRVFAQQRPRQAALGDLARGRGRGRPLRAPLQTHHALVDGISGVDIISVLFDTSPDPVAPTDPGDRWLPRRCRLARSCSVRRLLSAGTIPAEVRARSVRAVFRGPRRILSGARDAAVGLGAMAWAGLNPAPTSPYNQSIGPHRRFTWVRADLNEIKAIKNELGGTVNDVVLSAVAGALGKHLRRRGQNTDGLELKAMIPVSVRADVERGALGNRVAAMMAPLPSGARIPWRGSTSCARSSRASSRAARPWAPRCSPS